MKPPRLFIPTPPSGSTIEITGKEAHHLRDVLRMREGESVILFDGMGIEYKACVASHEKNHVMLQILSQTLNTLPSNINFCMAQGILKNRAWDILLEKAMELGLPRLIPMITEHTAVSEKFGIRKERWQKKLLAAAKQCGRNTLMEIEDAMDFTAVADKKTDLKLLAHNDANLPSLKTIFDQYNGNPHNILVCVGPEGGFSTKELELAYIAGFQNFSLGPLTLRAETAAMAIIANIQFYYGNNELR